jgi:hypothetical protein
MSVALTTDQAEYQQQALRTHQARFDEVLRKVGMRAPEPVMGQSELDYQRELLRLCKVTFLRNHELNKVNMRGLMADGVRAFTPQVLDAVVTEAFNPCNIPEGQIVSRETLDDFGQLKVIKWVGSPGMCFTRQLGRSGRKVISFRTDQGFVGTNGFPLR